MALFLDSDDGGVIIVDIANVSRQSVRQHFYPLPLLLPPYRMHYLRVSLSNIRVTTARREEERRKVSQSDSISLKTSV